MNAGGYGPTVATASSPPPGPYSAVVSADHASLVTAVKTLPTVQGTMKAWYPEKGYGFATIDSGIDVFVHIADCLGGLPVVGDRLRLELEHSQQQDGSSHWKAKNVQGGSAPLAGAAASNSSIPVGVVPAPCNASLPKASRERPTGAGDTMGYLKAWNSEKGFGFCSVEGSGDIFVHIADCRGAQPMVGDTLWFDVEQGTKKDGSLNLKAKNVMGGTGAVVGGSAASTAPAITPGSGPMRGLLKSWNAEKGFGFLHAEGCAEIFVHIADCIGSQPAVGDTLTFELEQGTKKDGSTNFRAKNVKGGSMSVGGAFASTPPAATGALPTSSGGQASGRVKSWNTEKGFGFAAVTGCGDIFVHVADCVDAQPAVGDVIVFDVEQGTKKDGSVNYRARNVKGGSVPLRSGDGLLAAMTPPSLATAVATPQYDYASLAAYGYAGAGYAYPSSQPGVAAMTIPAYGYLQVGQPGVTVQQPTLAVHQQTVQMQQPGVALQLQQPAVQLQIQQPCMQPAGLPPMMMALQRPAVQPAATTPQAGMPLQQHGYVQLYATPVAGPAADLTTALSPAATMPQPGMLPQRHGYGQLYATPAAAAPAADLTAAWSPAATMPQSGMPPQQYGYMQLYATSAAAAPATHQTTALSPAAATVVQDPPAAST
eukprot:TRINITY_DN18627_c0_g1_i1.p1 TRINITY_DN18627_c0_g1~~TRINITY_DN18627_c0_g1_i1.p1  ORF type:complete len:653 (+),score=127.05 TRINITY_DN18627_c0_g1_i1:33-1991(+)